ncbi:hypothetical protein HHK36_012107 [Tetracentron sinense]|uniref:HTH myb-type domain-containing protein n=1 Tax=Tetracentron sinense TaxID=13715 RepID=A0A835DKH9_TETSI|nr:hypothetical protein HHK36_012107 [Tetracentron sinense]
MYSRNHHGNNRFPSSRMSIPSERHLFLQGGNGLGDTGLVLSTDAKPRLKWTPELHERFIEAVNQLGGADKATPKTVMKLMGIPGLTLYHLKSHLQKYRLSKNLHGQANIGASRNAVVTGGRMSEASEAPMSDTSLGSQTNKSLQISETLQMQIEVQRRLHEQLEVQRHLQLRIEAQGKYLQAVLEKAQETIGRQNQGAVGFEAVEVQLSELVSKVSTKCMNSAFSGLKELPDLCPRQTQTTPHTDCSIDSCLTSCEGSQKDQKTHNSRMGYGPYHGNAPLEPKEIGEETRLEQTDLTWCEDLKENKMFLSSTGKDTEKMMFPIRRTSGDLSMRIGVQGEKVSSSGSFSEGRLKERDGDDYFHEQCKTRTRTIQLENEKMSNGFRMTCFTEKLDLNAFDENDAASSSRQFDLNGFSWS